MRTEFQPCVRLCFITLACLALPVARAEEHAPPRRPNILWICVEDMSPHMSCYGETTIQTPHIDALARDGTRFRRAFVVAPVCSPSRSAMITGVYQTSIGAHNHRSSRDEVRIRLPEHVRLIPEYFQQAGYHTSNGGRNAWRGDVQTQRGKTDYNFVWDQKVYDGADWSGRRPGQPFFAQIQLRGGKNRGAKVPHPVDPEDVRLPPYYPDHPVIREDWARYLNSVIQTDIEVGTILERLEEEGIAEETVVFFWTDHGISHLRDKQFLYEGGIHVPLIVRGPGVPSASVREDLVKHIDIPATSLALAGIELPSHLQGQPLFAPDVRSQGHIVAARDRCDETVDRIRCVRTRRYKYIRNYFPHRSHAQPNRYKDGKAIVKVMRQLYAEGKLTFEQARPLRPRRPVEELYDLEQDPYELVNLARSEEHREVLDDLRAKLANWVDETGDLGQFPEPVLEDLASRCSSAWEVLEKEENRVLARRLRELGERAEEGVEALPRLVAALAGGAPAVRYVAATGLGDLGASAAPAVEKLRPLLADPAPYVRVAAARAIALATPQASNLREALGVLERELSDASSEIVRHDAAMALEDLGDAARPALETLRKARKDRYDLVHRVATRVVAKLEKAASEGRESGGGARKARPKESSKKRTS